MNIIWIILLVLLIGGAFGGSHLGWYGYGVGYGGGGVLILILLLVWLASAGRI
jgi:hypothetical protein